MAYMNVSSPSGNIPAWFARPNEGASWAGVVVLPDEAGMSQDLRNQADWLGATDTWPSRQTCSIREGRLLALFRSSEMLRTAREILRRY